MTAFKLELLFFTALLGSVKTRSVNTTGMNKVPMGADDTVMGDMCQDCTQIFELLKDLVSNQDFQAKLTATLEQVCDKLPPQVTKICHTEVEKMLPLAITFISSIMNPSDICTFFGLCGGRDSGKMKDMLLNHMAKTVPIGTMKMEGSFQCSVCTYVVSTLGYLFPRERAQSIITILLESLCSEFPPLIQPQCHKLVEKYVQLLVDMLLNNTSPNFICTLLRLCEIRERPINAPPALSDCDSCLTLAVLTRMRLGSNATERQAASFLDTVCQLHPGAMPKCDAYVQHHGNQLRVLLSKPQGPLDICKRANLCVSGEKESAIAAGPCSLGLDYICRDLQTAVYCGAVSFCQMNAWG
ncbi:prosaposin isoform X1 [Rhinichthys klamathensis goyatoka]|uniref:prosaposin isoform X1 n=1 Tax=Rhinichthys klamathensis goyatoka TaxID=3034132 RepID=UPI0024B61B8E|nr:prosaposin isoform X1 [Rhinichthys klamathensis goyatoka]